MCIRDRYGTELPPIPAGTGLSGVSHYRLRGNLCCAGAEHRSEMCIRDRYMAHRKEKKLQKQRSRDAPVIPHGKQTVKQLVGQNQGISNIEITDPSIKEFEKIARKYGVDYAVKKDRSISPPKYPLCHRRYCKP